MNYEIKQAILQKIKEYDTICLFRHIRNDGDCVGSTKGLKALLQASFPEKEILLIDSEGIAERGTHEELLALGGQYATLCAATAE